VSAGLIFLSYFSLIYDGKYFKQASALIS